MSAIFKLVLGQKVVHPVPKNQNVEDKLHANGIAAISHVSSSSAAANGSTLSPRPLRDNQRSSSPNAGTTSSSGHDRKDAVARKSQTIVAAPASKVAASSSSSLPAQLVLSQPMDSPNSPRSTTPTRTLLLRIEGCTVAQDIRDALRDLLRCPDLPYALDGPSLKSLLHLLTSYAEDESITEPTLHVLANATDIDAYPSQLESNHRTIEVTMADKRHMLDELLQVLVDAVALLLESMNATAPFWSRYYAVVLLQRLEEYEPSTVNRALLAARGVGALLEALNETEHENALRKQALLLLTSLTLADRELQTLLAFDNAFDSLFDLVQREGGVLGGGAVVRDSLTVVHNILRSNKATQKFFREMGCATRLAALFDSIPAELAACTVANQRHGSSTPTAGHWTQPTVVTDKLEVLLGRVNDSDVMLNVLMSVSILACVLRGYEESEEELQTIQDALLRCGLLQPLTRLAFCGLAIDDATRIEAVRVLALLLNRSKRAVEEWMASPTTVTLVRATLPYTVQAWSVPRALLSYTCETTDTTLVNAGVQLFLSVLSVSTCQERVAEVFLRGLVGNADRAGGPHANGAVSPLSNTAKALPVNNANDSAISSSNQRDLQCGSALARILLSSSTSAVEKYYTAQVFRALISVPAAARLSESLARVSVPSELQQGMLDPLVKAQPGWTLSVQFAPSFFNYYVSFLLFAISGGAASHQMNTSALGAYVAALLAWTRACPWAATALVQEVSWGDTLLHQARRDGAAQLRLWSAMLIARGCIVVRAAAAAASGKAASNQQESTTAVAATTLAQRFLQMVGGSAALDTIIFDAQASTSAWQQPAASGLCAQTPAVYDAAFVAQVEQLVEEFKRLLSSVAGPSPSPMYVAPQSAAPPAAVLAHTSPQQSASLNAQEAPPPYSSSNNTNDAQLQQFPPSPQQQRVVTSARASLTSSSADFIVPSPSMLPQDPPPSLPPTRPVLGGSTPVGKAQTNAETLAFIESLESQLQAAQAERCGLMRAMDEWRVRAEQSETQCQTLQKAYEERAAALEAAEAELANQRAAAQDSKVSPDVVDGLRENIHLLEEALNSKDEERQQLVESLNMMEEQLRHATSAAAAANEQRAAAIAAAAQQQQQSQPLPLQQPQGPPPEVVAEMEAERNALRQRLAEAHEEVGRLQQALRHLTADYHELLLMVAELNEECVSVKALSSMAPTPARQLANWTQASPSVERNNEAASPGSERNELVMTAATTHGYKIPASYADAACQALPLDSSVHMVVNPEGQCNAAELPSYQIAEITHTASSVAYAEATDVLIDPVASPPSLTVVTAGEYTSSQHNVHPATQRIQPLPPPPPPPASSSSFPVPHPNKHGGLPHPVLGRQVAPHPFSRHVPRYADPSNDFFGSGAAAPTQVPSNASLEFKTVTKLTPVQSEAQEVHQHPNSSGTVDGGAGLAQISQQQLTPRTREPQRDAPPLPSADDFFGGGGDDKVTEDVLVGLSAKHMGTTAGTENAVASRFLVEPQTYLVPPPLVHEEESASQRVTTINPFLPNASVTHDDNALIESHTPFPTDVSITQPAPRPSLGNGEDISGSGSVKSDHTHTEVVLPPPPPPPPLPPLAHMHPVSALAGGTNRLGYKGNPLQGPQAPFSTVPHKNSSVCTAPSRPHEVPDVCVGQTATTNTTFNPFADFQGGGNDDDDGLADLR